MADDSPDVSLTVLNAADQKPIVYVGTPTALDVSLVNNSDTIVLNSSGPASTLEIFLASFFTPAEVQNMSISQPDWTFSVNVAGPSLLLTYAGPDKASWRKSEAIAFKITNVESDGQPTTDAVQVNFQNMDGNVPSQVQTPLTLSNPPEPGNASLRDVLRLTLDSQGSVFVSTRTDPLQNTLFLNLKNIGATPLRSGTLGTPQVTVAFVYGSTSGALAPDNDRSQPVVGSAWKIIGGVAIDQTDGWKITNPSTTGDDPHPKWLLAPVNTNEQIIGIGDKANVTFSFSQIVSLTPPGHTQVVVQFSGFMKDANTPYDDEVFVLDIVKQNPPPTRGLINFFGTAPIVEVTSPTEAISIPLSWVMLDVASVNLICSFPGKGVVNKKYPNPLPLAYDRDTLEIPGTTDSVPVFITLQAFDGNGAYLNSLQFTVFIHARMFVDPRDGKVYPVVLLNNQLWIVKNLEHDDGAESFAYNNLPVNVAKYGRLYTGNAESAKNPPGGWRIPSQNDWQGLFALYPDVGAAYKALFDAGASGFNARLGGNRNNLGDFSGIEISGFYRTSSVDGLFAGFSSTSKTVNLVGKFPGTFALSIRYVRDL